MFSGVVRDGAYRDRLVEFLGREYGLGGGVLSVAPRGYYGETWRLESGGERFFVKVNYTTEAHTAAFVRSIAVVDRLVAAGIDFIPRVIPAVDGRLTTRFDGAVVGVFEWIDAVNTETDDTKFPEYAMLARVYATDLGELDLPREDFSTSDVDRVYRQWRDMELAGNSRAEQWCTILERYRPEIAARAQRLAVFAARCSPDRSGFVLTHGDAGGNFMTAPGGRYVIADWDDVFFAPPERDAWVMCRRDWAREAFMAALRREGIDYELRPERLAYCTYAMFFQYLGEGLDALPVDGPQRPLGEWFEGWIRDRLEYADEHFD
jgi:hypothetical protein